MPKTVRDDTLFSPAGDYRHIVTVQENSTLGVTYGTRGEAVYPNVKQWTTRALVETLGGNEGQLEKQAFPNATHRVLMRYDSRLTSKAKIVFENSTLHIVSVVDVENRKRECIAICGSEL